jgi:phosphoribosylformimino-5-aminoimidazole carboxamide ribotide isomerase
MIIPCIDLMDGKVVQLVQGREKALEGDEPLVMLERFKAFPEIQVIDLDAAMGRGSNDEIVEMLASRAVIRAGGGVRTPERASRLIEKGAHRVIVGTSACTGNGINRALLDEMVAAVGRDRIVVALDTKRGRIVVKGWREATDMEPKDVISDLEPFCSGFLCTYVDKEGMLKGTDLEWFRSLRKLTQLEITAAGGITTIDEIAELRRLDIHCALGMAIYTGRLSLAELATLA